MTSRLGTHNGLPEKHLQGTYLSLYYWAGSLGIGYDEHRRLLYQCDYTTQ